MGAGSPLPSDNIITLATWNVNSVRSRLLQLESWMRSRQPDVVLLQETKCLDEQFPKDVFEDMGYNLALRGQKTFNGVAILSRFPLDNIILDLPGSPLPDEARYIEATVCLKNTAVRVASVYVPNGQDIDSPKYVTKIAFFESLYKHFSQDVLLEDVFCIGGDYNVAPSDRDVYDARVWKGRLLCSVPEREAFSSLVNLGYADILREVCDDKDIYTWWDYRAGAFNRNQGLRIDHFLLSPHAVDRFCKCWVDLEPRQQDKPSDHAPVLLTLHLPQ